MNKLSFSRQILPIIAIIGMIAAAYMVFVSQPDSTTTDPDSIPATAPSGQAATVAGAGVVEPSSELVDIAPEIAGVVSELYVSAGDTVSKGQLLFAVDARDATARRREAEARVRRLKSSIAAASVTLDNARQQLALYGDIADSRAISEREVIDRESAVRDARARLALSRAELQEAEAQLASARVTLDRLVVRAPMAGEILDVNIRPGEFAQTNQMGGNAQPAIIMGNTDPLHVRIDIDENEIERLSLGDPAVVSPRGNGDKKVNVDFVRAEPLVTPKTSLTNSSSERVDVRVLQLIYALPGDDHGLFIGQQVDAFVPAIAPQAEDDPDSKSRDTKSRDTKSRDKAETQ
ncbi:MAG: efflux RND transporter periplasmic adaptor subunit [Pseudomonadota bacterium]